MKTIRRNKLRLLCEQGRLEVVGSYHFDDQSGAERSIGQPMPAAMKPADWHDRQPGVCYLFPGDFDSSSGRAWENPDGTITLYVHSNCNYTLRIKENV